MDASAVPDDPEDYVPPEDAPSDEDGGHEVDTGPGFEPGEPQKGDGKTLVFDGNAGRGSRASAPAGAKGKLTIVGGPKAGGEWTLTADETTIGRGNDNVWVIPDISVSRRHVLVKRTSAGFVIHDQGSGNGTLVNGVRLEEDRILETGDEIEMGDTVLRFEAMGAPKAIVVAKSGRSISSSGGRSSAGGPSAKGASTSLVPAVRGGRSIAVSKGRGPRTGTARVRATTGDQVAAIPGSRRKVYAVLGVVVVLMLIVGVWVKLNKPKPEVGPKSPSQDAIGATAFKEGLQLFKQEKFEEALEKFDIARQNLSEPDEANTDYEETQKEISAKKSLAEANLSYTKGQLGPAMQLVSKIDSGSRQWDPAEELRKKIRDALSKRIKDGKAQLDAGSISQAEETINGVLKADPTNADANQVMVDINIKKDKIRQAEAAAAAARAAAIAGMKVREAERPIVNSQAAFAAGNDAEALQTASGCAGNGGSVGSRCRSIAAAVKAFSGSYRAGMDAARGKRITDAIRNLTEAKTHHRDILKGYASQSSSRLEEINKQLGAMYYLAGNQAQGDDNPTKACVYFRQAVEVDGNNGLARKQETACADKGHELYQQAYVDKGLEKDKAIRELHQALLFLPKNDKDYEKAQKLLGKLERGGAGTED